MALTASPPSPASLAALLAMPSVTLAFSVFCEMDAVICSTEALVSSTPAACSLAAWDSDCAVALTSSDALASASALPFTSATTCASFSTMVFMAASTLVLSFGRVSTVRVRSPAATRPAISATKAGSPPSCAVSERVMSRAMAKARTVQIPSISRVQKRAAP